MFTALANWDAASSATGSEFIEWVHHTTQDDGRMCEKDNVRSLNMLVSLIHLALFPGLPCIHILSLAVCKTKREGLEDPSCASEGILTHGAVPDCYNSQTSLKSIEQWDVLTLSFKHPSLKSLDKMLQEWPWDFLWSITPMCPPIITSHHHACEKPPKPFSDTVSDQKLDDGERLGTRVRFIAVVVYR